MQIQPLGSSDGEVPLTHSREMRTLSIDGRTFVCIHDVARIFGIDRNRLIRKLRGRAHLVAAVDVDGAERNLIVAPVEAFFAKRKGGPGFDPDATTI